MLNAVSRRFASPRRTVSDTVTLLSRATYRRVLYATGVAYLVFYLAAVGDISRGGTGWGVTVTEPSFALQRRSFAGFEAVAAVSSPYLTVLVSPLNIAVGGGIAALVGVNLAFSYYAVRNPGECKTRNAAGVVSSLPALLAGTVCCAPVILLVLGIQASAALLTVFRFALPLSVLLLVVSLAYVAQQADVRAHAVGS